MTCDILRAIRASVAPMAADQEEWMPFPATAESDDSRSLAPFESTPLARVEEAARLANIASSDVVVDLGCGDARLLLHLHAITGAKCVGYEIDPALVEAARAAVKCASASARSSVAIHDQDLRDADLSQATVIFSWLQPWAMPSMEPKLRAAVAERGARVISYMWPIEPWEGGKGARLGITSAVGQLQTLYVYTQSASSSEAAETVGAAAASAGSKRATGVAATAVTPAAPATTVAVADTAVS